MTRYFATRPMIAGTLAVTLVGVAGTVVAASAPPWEAAVLLMGTVSIGAAWALVLHPSRARHGLHESLERRAVEALRRAGVSPELPPAGDDLAACFDHVLTAMWDRVPRAQSQADAASTARMMAEGVLDGVSTPILGSDGSGMVIAANRAAGAFFGEDAAGTMGVVGRHLSDLFTQRAALDLHQRAASGMACSDEIRWVSSEGPRVFQVSAQPWSFGREAPGSVLAMRDITELAVAAQLKTDFVANASHEVRTPLSAIKAAVETLENGADEEPVMRARLIRMIADNATRLEDLTRDLLDLSRLESPEAPVSVETVKASSMVTAMQSLFGAASAEKRVSLEFIVDPQVAEFRTDPRLLQLILRNLVENSLKFAYEGSVVRISAEAGGPAYGSTSGLASGPASGPGVRWKVADQGIGIPLDQQQRIFERFYQVDPSRVGNGPKGTGLGLAIVKHAVKSLGGTIRVDSVWKKGTTMTVDLPNAAG